ncbi:MAG: M48 family metallopeptidase [Desulfomonilia bacterium]
MNTGAELNYLLVLFLILSVLTASVRLGLHILNISHLRSEGRKVPQEFAGAIDADTLKEMRDYSTATGRLEAVRHLFFDLFLPLLVISGLLPWLAGVISSWGLSFVLSGIIFLFAGYLLLGILGIPFDLYQTFGVEKRFSFSTISWATWTADLVKSVLISALVLGILLAAVLGLIRSFPDTWWLWSWLFLIAFQVLVSWLYPVVIAPVFNRFEPVEDQDLARSIASMAERAGFRVRGIYTMDAVKRSRHSNAYFTGIGKTKRIVLFDTLLNDHTRQEILAILAHELGHWKKGHIIKQMLLSAAISLLALYGAHLALQQEILYRTFGFDSPVIYAGLFILAVFLRPAAFFLSPVRAMISRRFERQSDDFSSAMMGDSKALIESLKRLASRNLTNLYPHPVYAWFFYSHPPVLERIRRLKNREEMHERSHTGGLSPGSAPLPGHARAPGKEAGEGLP